MIKEVALLFALKAFEIEVLNRTDMYKWSDSCPRWLQDVMNTFLDEYDKSLLKSKQVFISKTP